MFLENGFSIRGLLLADLVASLSIAEVELYKSGEFTSCTSSGTAVLISTSLEAGTTLSISNAPFAVTESHTVFSFPFRSGFKIEFSPISSACKVTRTGNETVDEQWRGAGDATGEQR